MKIIALFILIFSFNTHANEVIHGNKITTIKKMTNTGSGNININNGANNIRIFYPKSIKEGDIVLTIKISNIEHLKDDYSLSFLSKTEPEKFKHSEVNYYINRFNNLENERWRLPTFDELDEVYNDKAILSKYSDLEVWAESENGNPSFYKLDLGQRLSGKQSGKKKRYLLLVRDILGNKL